MHVTVIKIPQYKKIDHRQSGRDFFYDKWENISFSLYISLHKYNFLCSGEVRLCNGIMTNAHNANYGLLCEDF